MSKRDNFLQLALRIDNALPKRIGMSKSSLYMYSRGALPCDDAIARLERYFSMTLADLLSPAKITAAKARRK